MKIDDLKRQKAQTINKTKKKIEKAKIWMLRRFCKGI